MLKNLSFEAEPGHLTALVGPSGAGKSTVMGLLERFYDPSKGSIKLDGIDIKDINPLWLRQQMAIVPQEPILFNRSIRENMVYGCKDEPPMEEIEEAAKAANIYDFITTKCAEKWRTEVGKGGVKLSGGQKQRLAIARAILKKPKLNGNLSGSRQIYQKMMNSRLIEKSVLVTRDRRVFQTVEHDDTT